MNVHAQCILQNVMNIGLYIDKKNERLANFYQIFIKKRNPIRNEFRCQNPLPNAESKICGPSDASICYWIQKAISYRCTW